MLQEVSKGNPAVDMVSAATEAVAQKLCHALDDVILESICIDRIPYEIYNKLFIKKFKYFIYIEVYDFSISEDETINLKDGIKNTLVTRLGMQVRAVDAETGLYMTGSGLGKATTTRELTFLNDDNLEEVAFNQSSIGVSTRKALETAVAKIVKRMLRKGIFDH